MGVSARELCETQTMHFKRDSYPLLSTIAYGTSPEDVPVKIYTHLLGDTRVSKDCEYSFAGIKDALKRFTSRYGERQRVVIKSDGAEVQFWSRSNFYGLPKYFNSLRDSDESLDFQSVEWYKSTSGHGKGSLLFKKSYLK